MRKPPLICLILALACVVCAQIPIQRRVPWFKQPALVSGNTDWITQNGGAFVYWNSLDLNTNWPKVGTTNQWIDRIHGVALLQTANSGNEPTNSVNTNGVHFNGSQFLDIASNFVTIKTNATITNWGVALLFNYDGDNSVNQVWITDTNARFVGVGYTAAIYVDRLGPSSARINSQEDVDGQSFPWSTAGRWDMNTTKGHLMDAEAIAPYNNLATPPWGTYTNGIAVGIAVNLLHTNVTRIGKSGGNGYLGYLAALVYATNISNPANWASNVSNTWSNEFKFHR